MPLKTIITLIAMVIAAAALTLFVAFWVFPSLTGGTAWQWVLPVTMATALAARFLLGGHNDP